MTAKLVTLAFALVGTLPGGVGEAGPEFVELAGESVADDRELVFQPAFGLDGPERQGGELRLDQRRSAGRVVLVPGIGVHGGHDGDESSENADDSLSGHGFLASSPFAEGGLRGVLLRVDPRVALRFTRG